MVFQYYPESDMLYIQLVEGISSESEEITPGVVLDFDEARRVLGIEIEDASKLLDITRLELRSLPITDLIFRERVAG
ncbi:MAG: DUF2283 domain-containing protein [Chloroflexi bacterium]|nr:DUF2283 domain-containing protein [Chloroflexota bacterium]